MEVGEARSAKLGSALEPGAKPLQVAADPYAARAGSNSIGRQIQTVLADVLGHIERQTPLLIVSGAAGTGKSWLVNTTLKLCSEKALSARREDRGDLIDIALADTCEVLLVDEADSASPELLEQLLGARASGKKRRTIVLMCLPGSVTRFDRVGRYPPLLQLMPLSDEEAREFLDSGAQAVGRSMLFTRDAARLVIAQSGGSPRLLRRNASLAYFAAATDGQDRISVEHVSQALEANNFSPGTKNPNEGKTWTKADPSDHHTLYQKGPAAPPPVPGEASRQEPKAVAPIAVSTPVKPAPVEPAKSAPTQKPAEGKQPARKLSEFALYGSPGGTLRDFAEAIRAEKEEKELEKIKRREANRIFYHSWRFGK